MKTQLLILSLLAASVALPLAAATGPTPQPQPATDPCAAIARDATVGGACYKVVGGTGGVRTDCSGDDPKAVCDPNACPVSNSRVNPNQGCSDFVCNAPDWKITPNGGDNCLDMLCRNVPPTIQLVQITLAPVTGLLGSLGPTVPGATIVRAIVVNAGFSCDKGVGGPGSPGTGCQRVLSTPAGSVGADPDAIVRQTDETGTECSWVQSGAGGYTYAGDVGKEVAVYPGGGCSVDVHAVVILGYDSEGYHFSDSC